MSTRERYDRIRNQLDNDIDNFNIDSIKSNGISVRSGNQVFKFTLSEQTDISSHEDEIKSELKDKIKQRLEMLKSHINEKMTEMMGYVDVLKSEVRRKEQEYKDLIANTSPMPEITFEDSQRGGISVVKGNYGGLIYLVQGVYWPKFVDRKPIDPKYAKRLASNIVILIKVNSSQRIEEVSTRKPIGLEYFDHYHQQNADCWGDWQWSNERVTNIDEIIMVARKAESVLENVNTGSIATQSPRGLPRLNTLKRHVIEQDEASEVNIGSLSQNLRRAGISRSTTQDSNLIWDVGN